MAGRLPLVFTRGVAATCGYSPGQARRRIASGAWIRLRRGVYVEAYRLTNDTEHPGSAAFFTHLAALAAAVAAAGRPVWVAGASARWLFDLPEAHRMGQLITLCSASPGAHSTTHDGMTIRCVAVPPPHRTTMYGVPVLTPARVAVDALRQEGLAEALMIGDRALRRSLATRRHLDEVIGCCRGWPGIGLARQRVALLDPRRETPLESGSIALFVERNLPIPEPQYEVRHAGRLVGRADFAWVAHRVLGEADGKTKYVDDLPGSGPPEERIWRERLRQDGFLEAGWEVARWTDYERRHRPERVEQRIRAAMHRAQRLGLLGLAD